MKRPIAFAAAALALSACTLESLETTRAPAEPAAPPPPLAIERVVVRAQSLFVKFNDGTRCSTIAPEGTTGNWSGTTDPEKCAGQALPFQIYFRAPGGVPEQFFVEENPGLAIEEGKIGERAEVYINDVDGQRRLFVQPLGENARIRIVDLI